MLTQSSLKRSQVEYYYFKKAIIYVNKSGN